VFERATLATRNAKFESHFRSNQEFLFFTFRLACLLASVSLHKNLNDVDVSWKAKSAEARGNRRHSPQHPDSSLKLQSDLWICVNSAMNLQKQNKTHSRETFQRFQMIPSEELIFELMMIGCCELFS
jgi:hypothetical protein